MSTVRKVPSQFQARSRFFSPSVCPTNSKPLSSVRLGKPASRRGTCPPPHLTMALLRMQLSNGLLPKARFEYGTKMIDIFITLEWSQLFSSSLFLTSLFSIQFLHQIYFPNQFQKADGCEFSETLSANHLSQLYGF